jgi:hypothetical protein
MIAKPSGVEIGVSVLGGGVDEDVTSVVFFSAGGKFYFIPKNASPYIGGSFVALSASSSSGPFSSHSSSSYGFIGPGFEYCSQGGFVVRGSVYALLAGGGFFVWPGVAIRIAI